ncbi:ribonuclease HI family protein [Granulicella sp. L46]|jgi:ribonuclease HI|uniref:ribonuclease HI family protein n=1 Tax=Granulicella sp. L46 TaxID=1641865 RepID=UPI00131DD926|nr:ribonuclease HI family protein [Granulicella sp. L46]
MVRSPASLFPDETTPGSPTGWVIAHCDGGARGNPGPAGYGALLQDEAGAILAELSEFLGNRTNNYAEYSGLLGCLQWALDHGHSRLRVISDSELMVKQIQGKYKVNSPDLRPLWEEARRRIAQLDRFEISHALRHKNKAADQLANDAMDRGTKRQKPVAESVQTPPPRINSATTIPSGSSRNETPKGAVPDVSSQSMLRGFTRDGSIHLLGGAVLPDGIFVKIIPE